MNISAATLLASQSALAAPSTATKGSEKPAEFSPLLFKKTASAPVPSMAPAASAPAAAKMAAAAPATRGAYQRPGSTLDIKV